MLNILLVEDDAPILQFCNDALFETGESIQVFTAKSGEEALVELDRYHIDGAFIDIGLPGINGLSLAKEIRKVERYEFLPIAFATAAEYNHSDTYLELHYYDYISKPFEKDAFIAAASRFIGKIKAHNKLYTEKERRIVFQYEGALLSFPYSEVLYITVKSYSKKLLIVTKQQKYIRSDITLTNQLTELHSEMFAMCNKSCIVNISNIERIQKTSNKTWDIYFRDAPGIKCELSWKYHTIVKNIFEGEGAN